MANGGNTLTSQADCEELRELSRKSMECDTLMSAGSTGCPFSDNLGSWPLLIPLANCSTADRLRDQFLKSRDPRLGERFLHEPIPNTHKIDGCCRQHVLEMRFRPSNVLSVS
jgi:hypothetical protein